jgi:hypothetical protein
VFRVYAKFWFWSSLPDNISEHADPSRTNDKTAKNKRFLPVGKIASHNSPKQKKREQLTNNNNIYLYLSLSLLCCSCFVATKHHQTICSDSDLELLGTSVVA